MLSQKEFEAKRTALLEAMAKGIGMSVEDLPKVVIDFSNPELDLFLKQLDEFEKQSAKADFMCY